MRAQLRDKKVTCRYCGGEHFTARCPYKDTLGAAIGDEDNSVPGGDLPPGVDAGDASAVRAAGGKYVPPSMRSGGRGAGETMNSGRAEFPTLRVTNLSEDASDADMWELFGRFANRGRINRYVICCFFLFHWLLFSSSFLSSILTVVHSLSSSATFTTPLSHSSSSPSHSIYVGKDQDTGLCKGFGFVSFEEKADAEVALAKVHGLPYDHLILQVQWSVPKGDKPEGDRPRRD
jgi:translation initiation factor 3 subunit G